MGELCDSKHRNDCRFDFHHSRVVQVDCSPATEGLFKGDHVKVEWRSQRTAVTSLLLRRSVFSFLNMGKVGAAF